MHWLPIDRTVTAVRITFEATWGGGERVRAFTVEPTAQVAVPTPRPGERDTFAAKVARLPAEDLAPPRKHASGPRMVGA